MSGLLACEVYGGVKRHNEEKHIRSVCVLGRDLVIWRVMYLYAVEALRD